jgi:outer membrane lipoprotein-sorting protein
MLFPALILAALLSVTADPISDAIESYKDIETYRMTLKSKNADFSEIIKYYYKKPGFIRMEFIAPHKGAVLVYDPIKKKARVRPFDFFKGLVFTMSPDNVLLRSAKGHRVDESDIGALLRTVKRLQAFGKTEILGEDSINGRDTIRVSVRGKEEFTVGGINYYYLWLEKQTLMPLKVSSYDIHGNLVEDTSMEDLETNIELSEGFFDL